MSDIIEQDTEFFGIYYLCKNCGAQAKEKSQIKHHATCTPGEADKWEKFYKDAESLCFDCGTETEPLIKRDDGVVLCNSCLRKEDNNG